DRQLDLQMVRSSGEKNNSRYCAHLHRPYFTCDFRRKNVTKSGVEHITYSKRHTLINRPTSRPHRRWDDMDFELTNEQEMIRDTVRDFATNVIQPRTMTIDKEATFPVDIFKQMGELGLMGIPFPEVYGGSGGDTISYALAVEEIGKVCA